MTQTPRTWPALLLVTLVTACAAPLQPAPMREVPLTPSMATPVMVNEMAMLPLLGYAQLLARMTAQELARERLVLAAIPDTPVTQVRMAMLLAQPRGLTDLTRALVLLEGVLKSNDAAACSVRPLVQALVTQYSERLRLESQHDKLNQQLKDVKEAREASERNTQLRELQNRNSELEEKLNALTNIERSLPVRPNAGEMIPGNPR